MTRIVTHSGQFHVDDIFAVATLLLVYPDAEVIRSRDPEIIKSADIAVDVGLVYAPETKRFDHHQPEGAGKRENGIPYASFGLIWKEYGEGLAGEGVGIIDRKLAMPIDAQDNGVDLYGPKFGDVRPYTIGDYLYSYRDLNDSEEENLYKTFIDNTKIAQELLLREIKNATGQVEIRRIVQDAYDKSPNKKLVVFDEKLAWRYAADLMPLTLYVVYLRKEDDWGVGALNVNSTSFELKKALPQTWRGLTDEELINATGVADAVFCHRAGMLAVAKSKEGALKLAEKALNA